MKKDYKHVMPYRDDWEKLTGKLPVSMTNDYLFRALLQADEKTYDNKNVNLRHIELATDEDKRYGIDTWAKVFKATTWEELKMLASKNKKTKQAISSIWQLADMDSKMSEQSSKISEQSSKISALEKMISELQYKLEDKKYSFTSVR